MTEIFAGLVGLIVGLGIARAYRQPTDRTQAFRVLLVDTLESFQKELSKIPVGNTQDALNCLLRASEALTRLEASYKALLPWENFTHTFNEIIARYPWLRTYNLSAYKEGSRPTDSQ